MTNCHVLIPSGGSGQRFGGSIPKQYLLIEGKAIVRFSLDLFIGMSEIQSVWVGIAPDLSSDLQKGVDWPNDKKLHVRLSGGESRHETVLKTLELMISEGIPDTDWVLVHDAARPGIEVNHVRALMEAVLETPQVSGGILALPVADSLKQQITTENDDPMIGKGQNRNGLWQAQTPQMFRVGDLKNALLLAINDGAEVTDEASAFERLDKSVKLVVGSPRNFKITYPEDLRFAEQIFTSFSSKEALVGGIRIGQGYDVHRLVEGRPLILGGVLVPSEKGLLGHSDADALLHALTDALLGAAGLGDIGKHFPDTDPKFKGADSKELLMSAYAKVCERGYTLINMDATIICQQPKLSNYIEPMVDTISRLLQVLPTQINIKAKTNEGLGYLGKQEAIATEVCVLINSN